MTNEEFGKLPFRFVSHLAMEHEHCATYATPDNKFGFCVHTPYKNGEPHGKAYIHYRVGFEVYNTRKKLIKAIENL